MNPLSAISDLVTRWDAAYAKYEALDARLRAVISWNHGSRAEAELLEKERRMGAALPLHGMLVAVKDNIDVAGIATTAGSPLMADTTATSDAHVVQRLRECGAIIIAKCNMSELALGATNENRTFGACRSPWNTERTSGGSSGGSAAALAADYCEAALGTDTGGSIRIPASLNGVLGLRPTKGAVSSSGVVLLSRSQDAVGPLTHDAQTMARLMAAMIDHDKLDPHSEFWAGTPADRLLGQPLTSLKIGIPEQFFFENLDAGIAAAVQDFLRVLTDAGVRLKSVDQFGQHEAQTHWTRIVMVEGYLQFRDHLTLSPEQFSPAVYERLQLGARTTATEYAASVHWRRCYRRQVAQVFQDVDLLVAPAVPVDAPRVDADESAPEKTALGRLSFPWALHTGPTMTLPAGFHPESGVPIGVALVAAAGHESRLFQLAQDYQTETDWHERRPDLLQQVPAPGPRASSQPAG